jgi:hypothetical protein
VSLDRWRLRAGLHQVEDPDGFVEWSTAQPGAALSGWVRAYTGYREDTSGPVRRWETPVGELNLIVSFGDGFRAQAVLGTGELSSYISFVAGMHDRPSHTAHDGRQLGMQIRLDPLGALRPGYWPAGIGHPRRWRCCVAAPTSRT